METLIVSRHGESVASAAGTQNGEPARDAGLTLRGREQAEALGAAVKDTGIDLCVTSQFPRAQQTAQIALAGRAIPFLTDPRLNDIRYGDLEGCPKDEYHAWAISHGVNVKLPGGGESRGDVARRLCEAVRALLTRAEPVILVVAHELLITDLLAGVEETPPPDAHLDIGYATPYRLSGNDVSRGIAFLNNWLEMEGNRH